MKRVATGIVLFVTGVVGLYVFAFVVYRGTWHPAGQLQRIEPTAAVTNPTGSSNYPIQIEHGLPFPCLSHSQIMACLKNVVVTTDILGFHIVGNLERVILPFATISGSKRLGYVQGLLTVQANSDNVRGSVALTYDQPNTKGEIGAAAELAATGSIDTQSEGPGSASFSIEIADHKYVGKFILDSYYTSLDNLDKLCAAGAELQMNALVHFAVPSVTLPGTDAQIGIESETDIPVAVENCTALMADLPAPLLSNSWDKIWSAFEKTDTTIKFGDGDAGDWLSFSSTLEASGNDKDYNEASFVVNVSESAVHPDAEHGFKGTARVEDFGGKEFAKTAYILGLKKAAYYFNMPDVALQMELEAYHHQVTFAGCQFALGPFRLHPCAELPWP